MSLFPLYFQVLQKLEGVVPSTFKESPISHLSPLLVAHILSFAGGSTTARAGLVCKLWRGLVLRDGLWETVSA